MLQMNIQTTFIKFSKVVYEKYVQLLTVNGLQFGSLVLVLQENWAENRHRIPVSPTLGMHVPWFTNEYREWKAFYNLNH